jgi:protoporphyrinogen/coproporphyrinogen III oxidase
VIGIVGGGLTGLALAHDLGVRGIRHRLWEASPEPGGVMRTVRVEGRLLELGPQRVRRTPLLEGLAREVGLAEELITAPEDLPLHVYSRGRLRTAPLSLRDLAGTDLLTPLEKLRMGLEPLTGAARPGEDVASFLSRKFGGAAYRRFLGPLYGGLYASDPAEMEVELSLARALEELGVGRSLLRAALSAGIRGRRPPPACTFRDGLQALPRALAAAAHTRVELERPVVEIRGRDGGFEVCTDDGSTLVEALVLTVPAPAAARLLRGAAAAAADALSGLRYNPLAVVHLVSPDAVAAELRGYGYQVALDEPLETRGVTFNASLFGNDPHRRDVFTVYLGGMQHPELVGRPDEELARLAVREFQEVTGHASRAVHVHRVQVPAWDRSWRALERLQLPRGLVLEAAYTARPGIPGRLARARALAGRLAEPQPGRLLKE